MPDAEFRKMKLSFLSSRNLCFIGDKQLPSQWPARNVKCNPVDFAYTIANGGYALFFPGLYRRFPLPLRLYQSHSRGASNLVK
jgi:hypothetical protein